MPELVKPKAILFDFYNTLVEIRTDEHDPALWATLARFLQYLSLPAEAETLHTAFTTGVRTALKQSDEDYPEVSLAHVFQALLNNLGYTDSERFGPQITQLFRILSIQHFGLFPDTQPALQKLRTSFKIGLISDAQRVFIEPELAQVGLSELFDVGIISTDYGFRKPDPRLFAMALDQLNVSKEEAIFVGDDLFRDICGAQASGILAVSLKRHNRRRKGRDNCQPDLAFDTLHELLAWLPG